MPGTDRPLALAEVRKVALSRSAVLALAERLPGDEAGLDALLDDALRHRDPEALVRLMFAARAAERPLAARYLTVGAALIDDALHLAAFALGCTGDVAAALVAAAGQTRLTPQREATILLLAALWSEQDESRPLPPELVPRARILARKPHVGPYAILPLLALLASVPDEGLQRLLAPLDNGELREMASRLREQLLDCACRPLALLPETATGRTVASGYTVRRAVRRIGRNEPCPCGSGKKYKRCCYARDMERLQRSSDVPGVTVDELHAAPERHLNRERLWRMRPYELARLDPGKVPEALLPILLNRLIACDDYDSVVRALEVTGRPEALFGHWHDAIYGAALRGDREAVRRLHAVRPQPGEDESDELPLGVRLLLTDDPQGLLASLEQEALEGLREDRVHRLIDTAHELLGPYPALGILIARGVLPIAGPLDADMLLEALLEARDRLNLPPTDPVEGLVYGSLDHEEHESEHSEALAELRANLETMNRESKRLREEIGTLQEALAAKQAAPAPAPPGAPPAPSAARDDAERETVRRRLGTLKEELKERHRERNALRRELSEVRARLQTALEHQPRPDAEAGGPEPAEDELFVDTEEGLVQPLRVPRVPPKFHEALDAAPARIGRGALELIGRLAGGDPAAFRGMKRLQRNRSVCRQKVGATHRLLFRLEPRTLEVVALIPRQDLERTVRNL